MFSHIRSQLEICTKPGCFSGSLHWAPGLLTCWMNKMEAALQDGAAQERRGKSQRMVVINILWLLSSQEAVCKSRKHS